MSHSMTIIAVTFDAKRFISQTRLCILLIYQYTKITIYCLVLYCVRFTLVFVIWAFFVFCFIRQLSAKVVMLMNWWNEEIEFVTII